MIGADSRVQVVFTAAPDVFGDGVSDFLRAVGGVVVSWLQATQTRFDLALAASYGSTDQLHSPLVVLPHGAGYGKFASVSPGQPDRPVADREPYGLDAQRLVRDGRVIPAAIVLPHQADLARLARTCPPAVAAATVAGDPCYDALAGERRQTAGLPRLSRRRTGPPTAGRDLHLGPALVVWRSAAAAGSAAHRAAFRSVPGGGLFHPNVWYGHGRWQIQAWLGELHGPRTRPAAARGRLARRHDRGGLDSGRSWLTRRVRHCRPRAAHDLRCCLARPGPGICPGPAGGRRRRACGRPGHCCRSYPRRPPVIARLATRRSPPESAQNPAGSARTCAA